MNETREKWKENFERFQGWNTARQRRVQEREAAVVSAGLRALNLPHYNILEVGCGNGYFGKCVVESFLEQGVSFTYHFSDLLPESVALAKATCASLPHPEALRFSTLDVYLIDTSLGASSQEIILSTGFASAATYKDAVPLVSRALKKGGILVCDFVNHFSPTVLLKHPLRTLKRLYGYLIGFQGKEYYVGSLGIEGFFKQNSLTLIQCRTVRLRRNPRICMFRKDV